MYSDGYEYVSMTVYTQILNDMKIKTKKWYPEQHVEHLIQAYLDYDMSATDNVHRGSRHTMTCPTSYHTLKMLIGYNI